MTRPRTGSGLSSLLQVSVSVNSISDAAPRPARNGNQSSVSATEREQAEQARARQQRGQDQRSLAEARGKARQNRRHEQDAYGMHRGVQADRHLAEATLRPDPGRSRAPTGRR